jgi:putative transposase
VLAVTRHGTRRIRVLGAPPHPGASWVARAAKNLVLDLEVRGARARFLIRDRDGKFPGLPDAVLHDAEIMAVLSGVQVPGMNPVTERWGADVPARAAGPHAHLEPAHLLRALRESGHSCHRHRPRRTLADAAPLCPLPEPITDPERLARLDVRRRDRLGGALHEYRHAA